MRDTEDVTLLLVVPEDEGLLDAEGEGVKEGVFVAEQATFATVHTEVPTTLPTPPAVPALVVIVPAPSMKSALRMRLVGYRGAASYATQLSARAATSLPNRATPHTLNLSTSVRTWLPAQARVPSWPTATGLLFVMLSSRRRDADAAREPSTYSPATPPPRSKTRARECQCPSAMDTAL